MTGVPRCRWCELPLVRHRIGNNVTVWVHAATNSAWCYAGAPPLVATPRGRWRA